MSVLRDRSKKGGLRGRRWVVVEPSSQLRKSIVDLDHPLWPEPLERSLVRIEDEGLVLRGVLVDFTLSGEGRRMLSVAFDVDGLSAPAIDGDDEVFAVRLGNDWLWAARPKALQSPQEPLDHSGVLRLPRPPDKRLGSLLEPAPGSQELSEGGGRGIACLAERMCFRMAAVTRLETFVDVRDDIADPLEMSVSRLRRSGCPTFPTVNAGERRPTSGP